MPVNGFALSPAAYVSSIRPASALFSVLLASALFAEPGQRKPLTDETDDVVL